MTSVLILVPIGAEFRSVQQGLKNLPVNSSIQALAIPAGGAVRDFLQHLDQDWSEITQVVVMGLCGGLVDGVKVGQVGWYGSCQSANNANKSWRTAPQPPSLGEPEREKYLMSSQNWGLGGLIQWKAVTTEYVISSEMEKRSLHATTGCDVVDMETFWIVAFMQQRGISVMGLRVVCDGVRGDLPDLSQAFDSNGALQPWALGRSFVRKPVAALRLVWGSIVALRKLEDCAAMLGKRLTIS